MTDSHGLVGGMIGLGIGLVVADTILHHRRRHYVKKKLKRSKNWIDRETRFD